MGLFLLGSLVQQLQEAGDAHAPVLPATRLLTVLVPLVYRPALKVCTLPLHCSALWSMRDLQVPKGSEVQLRLPLCQPHAPACLCLLQLCVVQLCVHDLLHAARLANR